MSDVVKRAILGVQQQEVWACTNCGAECRKMIVSDGSFWFTTVVSGASIKLRLHLSHSSCQHKQQTVELCKSSTRLVEVCSAGTTVSDAYRTLCFWNALHKTPSYRVASMSVFHGMLALLTSPHTDADQASRTSLGITWDSVATSLNTAVSLPCISFCTVARLCSLACS